jgi:serine phosphatase RsbU (regulator of sigma subunit)
VERAAKERRAILIEDAAEDQQNAVTDSISRLRMRSIICAPLLSQSEEVLGAVQLDTRRKKRKFTLDDTQILASVARQAAISVEYVQLHQEKMRHVRLQRELDIARQVQYSLLPEALPELEGYLFWAYYQAAGPVGGDFYDFLRLPNGKQAVLLGDVAGKGVPAALNMVKVSTLCKVALLRHPDNVAQAMNSLNGDLCHPGGDISLASLILCVVDPNSHEVILANAGHMAPIFRRNDGTLDERLGDEVGGYMLGVEPECVYQTGTTRLGPGEFVVMYSDGISDAMNAAQKRYTVERIRKRLLEIGSEEPVRIGETLLEDVRQHAAGTEQHDDMALVVLRRDPE